MNDAATRFQPGRRFLTVCLLGSILSLGTIGLLFLPKDNLASPLKCQLVLKWVFDPGFAGEMIAAAKGFFRDENLDVTLQQGGFEVDPIRLVAGGAAEFGVAGADTFLIARSKNIPIVAIGAGYVETAAAYYVHSDSNIFDIRGMKGKKVGTQPGQDTETIFTTMLGTAGLTKKDVTEVPVAYDLTPFLTNSVDVWPGYVATQSYVLRHQQVPVPFRMIRPRDVGLILPGTVYFTSESFLASHPTAVKEFVNAVMKGWQFAYSESDVAVNLISKYDPRSLPPELVAANLADQKNQIRPAGYEFGEMRKADWEKLNDILLARGLIQTKINLEKALHPVADAEITR